MRGELDELCLGFKTSQVCYSQSNCHFPPPMYPRLHQSPEPASSAADTAASSVPSSSEPAGDVLKACAAGGCADRLISCLVGFSQELKRKYEEACLEIFGHEPLLRVGQLRN